MQTRYRNEYRNGTGNTQGESNEDQTEQDMNSAERAHLYDVIPLTNETSAMVHNTTTTNTEDTRVKHDTNRAATKQQQTSINEPPGHRDTESSNERQNQTTNGDIDDGNQENPTNTHTYHFLEQQSNGAIELKDHHLEQPAAYEIPVVNTAISQH